MANIINIIPNRLRSDTEYYRYHHLDLADLSDMELTDELNCLRVLLWNLPVSHWLRQRVKMLERELGKRKRRKWQ